MEGMVIDDNNETLYLAQEQMGIWRTSLYSPTRDLELMDRVNEFGVPYTRIGDIEAEEHIGELLWDQDPGYGSDYLFEDVEELTIYDAGNGQGYLIASSQGSSTFVMHDRNTNEFISDFQVGDGNDMDGAQHCDGAHVTNANLGGDFSGGLLVVQDGDNTSSSLNDNGKERKSTNFKYVKWEDIAKELNLLINNKKSMSLT